MDYFLNITKGQLSKVIYLHYISNRPYNTLTPSSNKNNVN